MTITVQEPQLEGDVPCNNVDTSQQKVSEDQDDVLILDGGFITPEDNAFGHAFRDYDNESERRAGVEEHYRIQHISQNYEYG